MPTTVTIAGGVYNQEGWRFLTGCLYITPVTTISHGDVIVLPVEVAFPVAENGDLGLQLVPSYGGVAYQVEFDPDLTSTKPRRLKPGYFRDFWVVPETNVDISEL